jgi:hypothetical protein
VTDTYSKRTEELPPVEALLGDELVHVVVPDGAGGYNSRAVPTAAFSEGAAPGGIADVPGLVDALDGKADAAATSAAIAGKADASRIVYLVGLATGVAALNLAAGSAAATDRFATSGYYAAADGGEAAYRRMAGAEAVTPGELVSADGVRLGLIDKQTYTPEMFGAKGDGANDDYAAWKALAGKVSGTLGGRVECRPGKTYLLNQNVVAGNGIVDIKFNLCRGLVVQGFGAKIKLKGGWDRDVATTRAISVRFDDCTFLEVDGLEIDGGGATITNSCAQAVPLSPGIALYNCWWVELGNLYLHHCIFDGLYIGSNAVRYAGKVRACRNVIARNVVCKFNVRLGLAVIQLRDALFEDCAFSFTAFNDEAGTPTTFLNGGGPKAGVDIEPDSTPTTPTAADVLTGNIKFLRCTIEGNSTSSFLCQSNSGGVATREQVHLEDCDIDHIDGQTAADAGFLFDTPGGSITNCRINARDSVVTVGYGAISTARQRFTGNECYGRMTTAAGAFRFNQAAGGNVMIADNVFVCTNTAPAPNGSRFFRCLNTYADFLRNRVVIPAAAYADFTADDLMIANTIDGKRAEGNRYETDLVKAAGSTGHACFGGAMYGDNTITIGEKFAGTSPGTDDTIRPGGRTSAALIAWDTTQLYSNQAVPASLLPTATVASKGAVPAPGASSGKFLKDDLTWANPAGGASPFPGYAAGRWYTGAFSVAVAGGAITTANTRLTPIFINKAVTISDLGVRISTVGAAGALVRIGIYASDANGLPTGAPLGQVNDLVGTALTTVSGALAGGNITLQPGLYWTAVQSNDNALCCTCPANTNLWAASFAGEATLANLISGSAAALNSRSLNGTTYAGGLPDLTSVATTAASTTSAALVAFKAA